MWRNQGLRSTTPTATLATQHSAAFVAASGPGCVWRHKCGQQRSYPCHSDISALFSCPHYPNGCEVRTFPTGRQYCPPHRGGGSGGADRTTLVFFSGMRIVNVVQCVLDSGCECRGIKRDYFVSTVDREYKLLCPIVCTRTLESAAPLSCLRFSRNNSELLNQKCQHEFHI